MFPTDVPFFFSVQLASEFLGGVDLTTLIIAVVGSGAFTAWLSWFLSRRKQSAETEGIVADTYSQVLADMREELTRYQKRIEALEKSDQVKNAHIIWAERRIQQLILALHDAHIPIPQALPTPPDPWSAQEGDKLT